MRSLCVASVALAPYLYAWVVFHRYAIVSSLFLLFVCVCVCVFLSITTMSFAGYFLVRSLVCFPCSSPNIFPV